MGVRGTPSHPLGLQIGPETRWVSAGLRRTLWVCRSVPRQGGCPRDPVAPCGPADRSRDKAWPGRIRVSAGPSGPLQVIVQLLRVARRLYPWGSDPWPRVPVFGPLHSSRRSAVSASPPSSIPAPQGGEAVVKPGNRRRARTKTLPCSTSPQAGLPSIRFLVP